VRAQRLENVTLACTDALDYRAPWSLDAVLFSLSYSVMQNRERILDHIWYNLERAVGW